MFALLLCLLISPPGPDLTGTWDSDNETVLTIRDNEARIESLDGYSSFTMTLHVYAHTLRMIDQFGVTERGWRLNGNRLTIGEVTYTRRLFLAPADR